MDQVGGDVRGGGEGNSRIHMPYFLKFTNSWDDRWTEQRGQVFWFVNLGNPWPTQNHPNRRMIERTTRDKSEARVFTTVDECRETLVLAGRPKDWAVVDEEGKVVE